MTNSTSPSMPAADPGGALKRGGGSGGGGASPDTPHTGAALDEPLGRSGMVDRRQFIRLLEQALSSLGFAEAARQLEAASGVAPQPPQVSQLQAAILAGDWAAATEHVGRLELTGPQAAAQARFIILEQAFLESLAAGDAAGALACLREQLTPLGVNAPRLHQLAARLMSHSAGGPSDKEAPSESRHAVLRRLQAVIPPDVMLPERRLEALVEQALAAQVAACRFHNTPAARPSLLSDYSCGTEQIPTCTTQVLLDHSDEVWHVQFSHDGALLASCGKDQTAIVWEVQAGARGAAGAVAKRHVLRGHSGPIAFLCWSPDDATLATCGQDALRLWDVASGRCLGVLRHHKDPVTCAAWFPDGRRLVTGSHDKQLCVVTREGVVERQWRIQRIQEVLVAKGGRYILATTCERKVRVYDLRADTESSLQEAETLMSMSLGRDGRHLLVNLTSNAMHLFDLGADPDEIQLPAMPCASYQGPNDKQSRFVVRSCLGGLDDRFVLTGSEECRVYVYHRHTGERLLSLEGHSGTVNSVAWNPADPHMFASASDDKSIHIWQTAQEAGAVAGGLQ